MKVSVIIPVYNVKDYLETCIKSVINQTFRDYELILVDDGSTDGSGILCDLWKQRDRRIRVIHKENGGLSDARNKGIDVAKGDYLTFIDSDDYVNPEYIRYLLDIAEKNDAEISMCKFQIVYDSDYIQKDQIQDHLEVISGRDAVIRRFINQDVQFVTAWAKLYKSSLFKEYRYKYKKYHEDEYLTFKLLFESKKVVRSDLMLYYYRQRSNSIMGQMKKIHPHLIEAQAEAFRYFEEKKDKQLAMLAAEWMISLMVESYYQASQPENQKNIYNDIKKCYWYLNKKKMLSSLQRVKQLFLFSPTLYRVAIPGLRKLRYLLRR